MASLRIVSAAGLPQVRPGGPKADHLGQAEEDRPAHGEQREVDGEERPVTLDRRHRHPAVAVGPTIRPQEVPGRGSEGREEGRREVINPDEFCEGDGEELVDDRPLAPTTRNLRLLPCEGPSEARGRMNLARDHGRAFDAIVDTPSEVACVWLDRRLDPAPQGIGPLR